MFLTGVLFQELWKLRTWMFVATRNRDVQNTIDARGYV